MRFTYKEMANKLLVLNGYFEDEDMSIKTAKEIIRKTLLGINGFNGMNIIPLDMEKRVLEIKDNNSLKTPRGTFKIADTFQNRKEAKNAGYGYYFTHNNNHVFTKHTSEYTCKFAIVTK